MQTGRRRTARERVEMQDSFMSAAAAAIVVDEGFRISPGPSTHIRRDLGLSRVTPGTPRRLPISAHATVGTWTDRSMMAARAKASQDHFLQVLDKWGVHRPPLHVEETRKRPPQDSLTSVRAPEPPCSSTSKRPLPTPQDYIQELKDRDDFDAFVSSRASTRGSVVPQICNARTTRALLRVGTTQPQPSLHRQKQQSHVKQAGLVTVAPTLTSTEQQPHRQQSLCSLPSCANMVAKDQLPLVQPGSASGTRPVVSGRRKLVPPKSSPPPGSDDAHGEKSGMARLAHCDIAAWGGWADGDPSRALGWEGFRDEEEPRP